VPETVLFQALFSQRKVSVDSCISWKSWWCFLQYHLGCLR